MSYPLPSLDLDSQYCCSSAFIFFVQGRVSEPAAVVLCSVHKIYCCTLRHTHHLHALGARRRFYPCGRAVSCVRIQHLHMSFLCIKALSSVSTPDANFSLCRPKQRASSQFLIFSLFGKKANTHARSVLFAGAVYLRQKSTYMYEKSTYGERREPVPFLCTVVAGTTILPSPALSYCFCLFLSCSDWCSSMLMYLL